MFSVVKVSIVQIPSVRHGSIYQMMPLFRVLEGWALTAFRVFILFLHILNVLILSRSYYVCNSSLLSFSLLHLNYS